MPGWAVPWQNASECARESLGLPLGLPLIIFASRLAPAGQGAPPGIEYAGFPYIYCCFFVPYFSPPLRRTGDPPCPRHTERPLFADKDVPPANFRRPLHPQYQAGQRHSKPPRNTPGKPSGKNKTQENRPKNPPGKPHRAILTGPSLPGHPYRAKPHRAKPYRAKPTGLNPPG